MTGQSAVEFTAVQFSWKDAPAAAKEGPGEGELTVDGISGVLRRHLRTVALDGNPITCAVLIYRIPMVSGAPNWSIAGPHQRYEGFRIEGVTAAATSVRASLKVRDYGSVNFPRVIFSRALYPSLHG